MTETVLSKTAIRSGIWQGVLETDSNTAPQLAVLHQGAAIEGVTVEAEAAGRFTVKVPIPVHLLADGVQSFIIQDAVSGEKLNAFSIVTGEPLEDDIRSEIDLLRAELDMLKKAFRHHCWETGQS